MATLFSIQFCDQCGRLKHDVKCGACDGKGYHRKFLFIKRTCEQCSGNGRVLQCPNQRQHFLEANMKRTLFKTPVIEKPRSTQQNPPRSTQQNPPRSTQQNPPGFFDPTSNQNTGNVNNPSNRSSPQNPLNW